MYADRDYYVADPLFVQVPVAGMLDPAYVASRARLIGERAGPPPSAGSPPTSASASRFGADATVEAAGTSHFVVVDAQGDVVSMTTSVESLFGSGRAVDGFFLNNQNVVVDNQVLSGGSRQTLSNGEATELHLLANDQALLSTVPRNNACQ